MSTPRFDLVDIATTIQRRRKFILFITLFSAALGTVFYLLSEKKYEARSEFVVANPMIADRSYIFRTTEPRYIDYFAGEDDIDHVMAIANSETVKNTVIDHMHLFETYKLNDTSKKDQEKMGGIWKKRYDVMRTEYKNVELSYQDTDPQRAAEVVNEAVRVIEGSYRHFYNSIKSRIYLSLEDKIHDADSTIVTLSDTLAALRNQYGIYDIISPARENIMSGSLRPNGGGNFGKGVEEVQNIESIKDQYVVDRAKNISLLNEFSTGTKLNDLNFFQVISEASPPLKPAGLGMILTVIACAIVGFLLSAIIALMSAYFRALTSVDR